MTLIIFDIDGTLIESFVLDTAAYVDALRDVFGFDDFSEDWASYRHVTDIGILTEVFVLRHDRAPSSEEIARVQARYVALLSERVTAAGGLRPLPGVADMLAHLFASPEHAVAYASGCWGASARYKMQMAGLPTDKVPCAFCDDDISREGIWRLARQRSEALHGRIFSRVVCVGDGVWDVRTARRLGHGFVGVGRGVEAERLRAEGAVDVLADFQDVDGFLALLPTFVPLKT